MATFDGKEARVEQEAGTINVYYGGRREMFVTMVKGT